MAETNKGNTQQECSQERKVSATHLVYLSIIFVILTILFWTLSLNNSSDALRLFSFASTITSIVLAVVSITYSIVSGKNVDASLGSISKTSDDIRTVGHEIRKIGEGFSNVSTDIQNVAKGIETVNTQLSGEIEKLSGMETNVHEILSSNEELSERVNALLDAMHKTQDDVKGLGYLLNTSREQDASRKSGAKKTKKDEFDQSNYTIAASLMLYACSLTQQEGNPKSFPLSIILNEQWNLYFYGYAYAMSGLLDSNVFDVEVEDKTTLIVKKFDVNYFKNLNRESLLRGIEKKDSMEKRLNAIDTYFAEHKEGGAES